MRRKSKYPLLVVDAGNTAVKFAAVARADAVPKLLRSVPTAKLTTAQAHRIGTKFKSAIVSSVVPVASRILKKALPTARFIGPRTVLEFETSVDRKTIGSDRLANVTAVHARFGGNVLVASFGTAATFDILDADGVHRGGAIAPGWTTFVEILPMSTALLPRVTAKTAKRFIGRSTRDALAAGVAGGYGAMILHIITEMKNEARLKKLRIVVTGGDAAVAAKLLRLKVITDPLLTLRGIAILAEGIMREGSK